MTKYVELTQGYTAVVDDDDYDLVSGYSWQITHPTRSGNIYASGRVGEKLALMHRLILGLTDSRTMVDHINCDGLDNRRANLRLANKSQNNANQRKQPGKSSQYKGVFWNKAVGKWMSSIKVDQNKIDLGFFQLESDAANAYNLAAIEYFGEFARINEIVPDDTDVYQEYGKPGKYNRVFKKPLSSIYVGVTFDKSRDKWVGQIKCGDKRLRKRFDNEVDAARFYDAMAIEFYGESAITNFQYC